MFFDQQQPSNNEMKRELIARKSWANPIDDEQQLVLKAALEWSKFRMKTSPTIRMHAALTAIGVLPLKGGHYLRHSLAQHRRFIESMRKRSSVYGSDFSGSIEVDCEAFLRDLPPLKNSTHTVITKAFLKRIMKRALANMRKERAA